MSAEQASASPAHGTWCSPGALGNLTIGLLILALVPGMFDLVDPSTVIMTLPWTIPAFPVLLIVVVLQFREGDVVGATANGVLGAVLMGQNIVRGLLALGVVLTGHELPGAAVTGGLKVDGFVYLVGGIVLLTIGWLAAHAVSLPGGVAVSLGGAGFLCVSAASFGLGSAIGRTGSVGLTVIAVWLLYSGLAMLISSATGRPSLPIGRPLGKH